MGRRDRGRGSSCRHRNGSPRRGRRALQQRAVRRAADRDTAQRRSAGIHVALPTRSARRRAHGVSQDSSTNRPRSRAPDSPIARQTRRGRTPDARGPGRVCACRPPRTRWSRSVHMAGLVDAAKARAVERLCPAALRRTSSERADLSERRRRSPAHVAALRPHGRIRCGRRCAGVDHSSTSRHAIRARAVVSSGTDRSARRWPRVQARGARAPASPNRGTGHRLH